MNKQIIKRPLVNGYCGICKHYDSITGTCKNCTLGDSYVPVIFITECPTFTDKKKRK